MENKNQWSSRVDFGARVPGGNVFVRSGAIDVVLIDKEFLDELHEAGHHGGDGLSADPYIDGHYFRIVMSGANTNSSPIPFGKSETYYNYFLGDDPSRWASRAYAYDGMIYSSVYEGIDLKIYSWERDLKYDFIVRPGADPSCISLTYDGAADLTLVNGDLNIATRIGTLIEKSPVAYQMINGNKVIVPVRYRLDGAALSFEFPEGYDECYELVIDPLLIFSTYSGSTADNWGSTATPGENGTLYSAGVTIVNVLNGEAFPATTGAFQTTYGGLYDIGILKYDSAGQQLLYASYLGGTASESPHSLVVNKDNELLVLGTTSSVNFPTTADAFDQSFNGGTLVNHVIAFANGTDIIISRISKDGDQLLSSTYIGGTANDGQNPPTSPLTANYGDPLRGDIITDSNGDVFVSSVTASSNFPLFDGYDVTYNGGSTDAVIFKMSQDLSTMLWGTFLGGSGVDASHTLKLTDTTIFIAGGTTSTNFPGTAGGHQPVHGGGVDGWIARLSIDGTQLEASTFVGKTSFDQVYFIDLNSAGDVYVYGQTSSSNFPVTPASVYHNLNSGQFVQKYDNDLVNIVFSTRFGSGRGYPDISPTAFLVNDCNNLYMTGWGGVLNDLDGNWPGLSQGMPLSDDAFQKTTSGSDFYFMVLTDDASRFLYGTYMGGPFSKTHVDGGTSRFDKSGIVYHAVCSGCAAANPAGGPTSDFPTTPGAWSRTNNSPNCNNAAFKFDLSSLRARIQTNTVAFDRPGIDRVCLPDDIRFQNKSIGGELFEWDFGDGTTLTVSDTSSVVHKYNAEADYVVKLKAIDVNTCAGKDSTSAIIHVFDRHSVVQDDDVLCQGDEYELKASGGVAYSWRTASGFFQSKNQFFKVSPADTTAYYVAITEPSGCVYADTVVLNVVPHVGPKLTYDILAECFDRPGIRLTNSSQIDEGEQFLFDFGDGITEEGLQVTHWYENDGTYRVKLIGTREFCVYEDAVELPIYTARVPNIITPGSADGSNDVFIVQYGDQKGGTPADHDLKVSLLVYNRWGTPVYESKDYRNNWRAEGLPSGVYYYEVTIGEFNICRSWLHVIQD